MTSTSSVSYDQAAYDALAYLPLRAELIADQIADVMPTRQTHKGATVTFFQQTEMAPAVTELTEGVDVDAVAIANSTVVVTLREYGNAVNTTKKLRVTSLVEINPLVANLLAYNAGDSIDTVAMNVLVAGSNVRFGGDATSRTTLSTGGTADVLAANLIRRTVADLRTDKVVPFEGGMYAGLIHPHVVYDLTIETGEAGWKQPHIYSSPEGIWRQEIGSFAGVRFMETSRAPLFVDASNGAGAAGTIDAYATLIVGRQALAKAFSNAEELGPQPRTVVSPVVDKLKRNQPLGWLHFVGYGRFREVAIRRIETISTIGSNA